MKYKIQFSTSEGLYQVQSKRLLGKWENMRNYFYTDEKGKVQNVKGFPTYDDAEIWMQDRYPGLNFRDKQEKNENIIFGF